MRLHTLRSALPEIDASDPRDVHSTSALRNLRFMGLSLNWSSAALVIVDGQGASHVEAGVGRRTIHQIDPRPPRLASRTATRSRSSGLLPRRPARWRLAQRG